jgi:hypothetical protein
MDFYNFFFRLSPWSEDLTQLGVVFKAISDFRVLTDILLTPLVLFLSKIVKSC